VAKGTRLSRGARPMGARRALPAHGAKAKRKASGTSSRPAPRATADPPPRGRLRTLRTPEPARGALAVPQAQAVLLDPWLARQHALLANIRLCDDILAVRAPDPDAMRGVAETREHLHALVAERTRLLEMPRNVDVAAPDAERVAALWSLLGTAIVDLDQGASSAARTTIKRFLLHVAWHEGAELRTRVQHRGGPARSFFQLEAHRAKDGCQYARSRTWSEKLATAAGRTVEEIDAAAAALPDWQRHDPGSSARFPNPNEIEEALRTNDLFAIYLTRVCLKKITEPIPTSNEAQADYWYRHWKRTGGDPVQLKQVFKRASERVDRLLPT